MLYQDLLMACQVKTVSTMPSTHDLTLSIDTRTLRPGEVYLAVQGARYDGHDFVHAAQAAGAIAAIVARPVAVDLPQIIVPDTTQALGKIAEYWRKKFSIPVIAITGSVGKSTVRNMVTSILRSWVGAQHVLAPEKNFNNHWGMPLVLCRLSQQHQYVVLEMGMNHAEEIRYLSKIAQPTVGVVTNAGTNHIGLLGSVEKIAQAKGELLEELPPHAVAVLNQNDPFYSYWSQVCSNNKNRGIKICSFGGITADISAINIQPHQFSLRTPYGVIDVQRRWLGQHNIANALAATAAVMAAGVHDLSCIQAGLEQASSEPGRLQVILTPRGVTLINDTYNSGETSLYAALQAVEEYPAAGRKIAVLGDMSEIIDPEETHQRVGRQAATFSLDAFIGFGMHMQEAWTAYTRSVKHHFLTHLAVADYLNATVRPGDVVLLKGARCMQMEKIIDMLR